MVFVHQFKRPAATPGDAGQRIVGHEYRQASFLGDQAVDAPQQRTAAGYENGAFADEIVPVTCNRIVWDKETGEQSEAEVTVTADEGVRATTAEGLAGLKTVIEGGTITTTSSSFSKSTNGATDTC